MAEMGGFEAWMASRLEGTETRIVVKSVLDTPLATHTTTGVASTSSSEDPRFFLASEALYLSQKLTLSKKGSAT